MDYDSYNCFVLYSPSLSVTTTAVYNEVMFGLLNFTLNSKFRGFTEKADCFQNIKIYAVVSYHSIYFYLLPHFRASQNCNNIFLSKIGCAVLK